MWAVSRQFGKKQYTHRASTTHCTTSSTHAQAQHLPHSLTPSSADTFFFVALLSKGPNTPADAYAAEASIQAGPVGSPKRSVRVNTVSGSFIFDCAPGVNVFAKETGGCVTTAFVFTGAGNTGSANDVPIVDGAPPEFKVFVDGDIVQSGDTGAIVSVDVTSFGVITLARNAGNASPVKPSTIQLTSTLFQGFNAIKGPLGSPPASLNALEEVASKFPQRSDPSVEEGVPANVSASINQATGVVTLRMLEASWSVVVDEVGYFVLEVRLALFGVDSRPFVRSAMQRQHVELQVCHE